MSFLIPSMGTLSGTPGTSDFSGVVQQTTILDQTNLQFVRGISLSNNGVKVARGSVAVGIPMGELIKLLASNYPQITWPPIFTLQPVNQTVVHPAGTNFPVAATVEVGAVNYQWRVNTDAGYVNLTGTPSIIESGTVYNSGTIYSQGTTSTLQVLNSLYQNGAQLQCAAWNLSGTTLSNTAVMTVT